MACGTLGKHFTKPSEQIAAPDCIALEIILPELDVAVPDEEGEVVPGHVGRLAGQQQDAVERRRPMGDQNFEFL